MNTATAKKKTQAAQVYFPVDVYWQIKFIAEREDMPMATWIREVVTKEVEKKKKKKKKFTDLPTFSHPGVDPYTSEKIDEIAYDDF